MNCRNRRETLYGREKHHHNGPRGLKKGRLRHLLVESVLTGRIRFNPQSATTPSAIANDFTSRFEIERFASPDAPVAIHLIANREGTVEKSIKTIDTIRIRKVSRDQTKFSDQFPNRTCRMGFPGWFSRVNNRRDSRMATPSVDQAPPEPEIYDAVPRSKKRAALTNAPCERFSEPIS